MQEGLLQPEDAYTSSSGSTAVSVKVEKDHSGYNSDGSSPLEGEQDVAVTKIARQITSLSTPSTFDANNHPFHPIQGSNLDPQSESFRPRAWLKSLVHLKSRDPLKFPHRTAGIAFRNLNVYGYGNATDYQKSVGNIWLEVGRVIRKITRTDSPRKIDILSGLDGVVNSGEMLVVLGPPGSGCSTLLKTIAGETSGIYIDEASRLNYQGISAEQMGTQFRGEAIYTAEVDVHFPMLSVGDTLAFAAMARAPRDLPGGVDKWTYATQMRDVIMAMFGISHTINTRVGDDFIRGVSGGERKRVSIAEAFLSEAPLQCWDNSTRGLDSANAIEFCRTLRQSTDLLGSTACVAIYQAPGAAYDIFDKVTILYDGLQIFFGPTDEAKTYFEKLGFQCPDRQTDCDFLTSMTSAKERVVKPGWEERVPKTARDFASIWNSSPERTRLLEEITNYDKTYPVNSEHLENFKKSRRAQQSKQQNAKSPYTIDYLQQIRLCLWRAFKRLRGDPSLTITQLVSNFIMSIVVGSVFFNLNESASSFFSRGSLLFFAVLINAIGSSLEILILYAQRSIVEKHSRYALYHPSAEAFASMLADIPYKTLNAFTFNIPLYFMTNLKRDAGSFFFFILATFLLTLAMSMVFRTIAATSRTLAQALAPGSIVILSLLMYSGFAIPKPYILGWSEWIYYLDPLSYAFESLMVNEFSGRTYSCVQFVPAGVEYAASKGQEIICSAVGAKAGQNFVYGDDYINSAFEYKHENKWRNIGIIIAFILFFCATHVLATEYISEKKSKGEILLFPRGAAAIKRTGIKTSDIESSGREPVSQQVKDSGAIHHPKNNDQAAIFHWEDVSFDIKIKGQPRRILDYVDGWIKPGTLTALMGVSGAGKTTLLDVLASRVTTGVITGGMFVDGQQRDESFQRSTGYVQQQDLHLSTTTVREALAFSALLRQPGHISRKEKLEYVEEVIDLLDMGLYADAVVGVPGEGLNVEQRKRLTIGVELAAKPQLLLFLDEPTSGLDSQTSWIICDLLEKLKKSGQAILCTIHQPSAMLFERFDRLLFLAKGGKTVYFGEIGENSRILTGYFERNGAPKCAEEANPADWMLEIIGAAPGSSTDIDWPQTWKSSTEFVEVKNELANLRETRPRIAAMRENNSQKGLYDEFAAPFRLQLWQVSKRVFEQYWRTPSYIYSKAALSIGSAMFIGFSFFDAENTRQGLQNQTFSLFMLFSIFGQLAQQIMPNFVTQRSLYEVRERPSKTYSWKAFVLSNIIVEMPWNVLMAVFMFLTWYYPIGLQQNAVPTNTVSERGALTFLYMLTYLIFTSTFSIMIVAAMDQAAEGANIANLLFSLSLIFCGVLASKESLPGFWIFMYRVSPFTYLVGGMLSTAVANTDVVCAANEYLTMQPTLGSTCGEYLSTYITTSKGYVLNGNSTTDCMYCPTSTTNDYLATISIYWSEAWRNLGLIWVYIAVNILGALAIYWLVRMPKKVKAEKRLNEKSLP